jgi:hypothetical protein
VEYRVLGPIEVRGDGVARPLGGAKQKAVIAVLVAAAGRPVSVDTLLQAIYGDDASPGSRATLQTYVSNLRNIIGDVIVWRADAYLLDCTNAVVDATEFENAYNAALQRRAQHRAVGMGRTSARRAVPRHMPTVPAGCVNPSGAVRFSAEDLPVEVTGERRCPVSRQNRGNRLRSSGTTGTAVASPRPGTYSGPTHQVDASSNSVLVTIAKLELCRGGRRQLALWCSCFLWRCR